MSGVAAIFHPGGGVGAAPLEAAVEALRHRGPDGRGSWLAEHRRVALGQARLALIDAAGGAQPIANEDGSVRIVTDGAFYGTAEERRRLTERGHRFATASDAEVAVHLYEELGTRAIHRLRGEFSFVLWDEANGLLMAARDRFGARPLFYTTQGERLLIASEAKALFAAGVAPRWDREAVYQQLFVCMEDDRSLFAGIAQVPPGCFLLASLGGHRQVLRYWDLDYPPAPDAEGSAGEGAAGAEPAPAVEELIPELRRRIEEAVKLRLEADSQPGFFLSGGVDSSTVLSYGARHVAGKATAFTVTFREEDYDETAAAREVAERAGADLEIDLVTDADLADNLVDAVLQGEMLGVNTHGVARYVHSRLVQRRGYRAVLSGEGSDDIFAGYPAAKQDQLLASGGAEVPGVHQMAGSGTLLADGSPKVLAGVRRSLGFAPAWMRKVALTRSVFHALLSPEIARAFGGRDPYRVFLDRVDIEGQLAGREPVIQSLYLWSKAFLGSYALCAERLAMGFSLEERVPFMDHRLFDLVRTIPAGLLVREMKEKWILREAARPLLPESTYRRPKHSFTAPPSLVTPGNPLYEAMQQLCRSSALEAAPFFDPAAVAALLDQLPNMPQSTRVGLEPVCLMMTCIAALQQGYRPGLG